MTTSVRVRVVDCGRTMTDTANPGQLVGAIFSASPDAIVVIDETGKILLSSPAVTTLFGYYPEELVGEQVEVLLPDQLRARHVDHVRHFFAAPRARLMGVGLELSGRHRDGDVFAVEVSLAPVQIRGESYAAAFVRDGRERQRGIERLHAVNEITQFLLAGSGLSETLTLIAERARRLSHADAVWIVTPAPTGDLEIASADGPGTGILLGVVLSAETSRSAEVMRTGRSEVIEDLYSATNVPEQVIELDLGPGLYVPLIADERRLGTLVLARVRGAPQFEQLDIAFAEVFASSTAAAIERGEVRTELERLEILKDEERIAQDLHDTVIQQLFAIGMTLQATRASLTGREGERIDESIDNLDSVIREIRNTIFRLPGRRSGASGLRDEILRLVEKHTSELGFSPRVAYDGPVDASVPDAVSGHLLQVLGEGLSNIVRHAHASAAEVVLTVEGGRLSLLLADDGVGFGSGPSAGQGIRNMMKRASDLGGSCEVSQRSPSGTLLEWRVPI